MTDTLSSIPSVSKKFSVIITTLCILLLLVHAIFPTIIIDNVTLGLIIIIIFAWLIPFVSSIKLPGGTELSFYKKVEKLEDKVSKGSEDLIAVLTARQPPYGWTTDPGSDPNLALAGLRIEIEKKIRELGKKKVIVDVKQPLRRIIRSLYENQVIPHNEYEILNEIIDICNKAVHGEKVDVDTAFRILDIGEKILAYLDKLNQ